MSASIRRSSLKTGFGNNEQTSNAVSAEATPQERIAARRSRIENSKLAQKSKQSKANGQSNQHKESRAAEISQEDEKIRDSLLQVQQSKRAIEEVRQLGDETVTSVLVNLQARELKRRQEESVKLQQWQHKLSIEKTSSKQMQDVLSEQWSKLKQIASPYDLDKALKQQKDAADKIIQLKTKLAQDQVNELRGKDDEYVKEFKKQSDEIDQILEKMDTQYHQLVAALTQEGEKIEKAYVQERNQLINGNKKELESLMEKRRSNEKNYTESKISGLENQHQDLQNLRTHDSEEYNLLKIKLETDIQVLEQQLSQMRGTYQLNMEKLEYNFQVLKKREEENAIILAAQKRRVTKLTDHLNSLRQKVAKQEKSFDQEFVSLTSDLKRMTEQYEELHKKYKHFQVADEIKYQEVKHMQESSMRQVIRKLLQADRIIHEEQLGEEWSRPQNEPLLKLLGLEQRKEKSASPTLTSEPNDPVLMALKVKEDNGLMRQIFDLITSEASFLVEDKLNDLLQPLEPEEQSLIKIDAIFKAVGVRNVDDIDKLTNYFIVQTENGQQLIEPDDVVKALKKFTEDVKNRTREEDSAGDDFESAGDVATENDPEKEAQYWDTLAGAIDNKTFEKWMLVFKAMQQYNLVLTQRSQLIQELLEYQNQNEELEMILSGHEHSSIYQELCLPPAKII